MKINFLITIAVVFFSHTIYGQHSSIQPFPLTQVKLLDSPFKQAESVDLTYMLALDPDRLLAPFLADAGLPTRAERYGNWENTGLDGHIGGHYLSALALMYASTGNAELLRRLNYMVDQLAACQKKNGNGYVGGIPGGFAMWKEVEDGRITADNFSVNKKWVPWYNMHKLYAGLRDAYLVAGNLPARDVLIKLSDWCLHLTSGLTDDQVQKMLGAEHGGMNEVLADVAAITGDKKYLELAKRFSHKLVLGPLLKHDDKLNGMHANTQIPKVIGFKRIAEVSGDTAWAGAAAFFWQTVVNNRSVAIGGNSVREHFHPSNDFSSMVDSREGPETCNTYNMLRLSKLLYLTSGSLKYIDYYERALYNHILSSQHPVKGGFVYFTPMCPQHYRVYSQPQQCFWCCVGSGLENHGKYGEIIYSHSQNDLFVNLFIASQLNWKEKGITLVQKNRFPEEETTTLTFALTKPQKFALNLRYPVWVSQGGMKVSINGKEEKVTAMQSTYVVINRTWKQGDVVSVKLPMHAAAEYLPDRSAWAAFVYGPLVLAAKTDTTGLSGLFADGSRMGHIANGPLYPQEKAPMLVTTGNDLASKLKPVAGKKLTFQLADVLYPESFKPLELIPFYQVHETRYMIYWPVTTPEKLEKMKQDIREREKARLALESKTIDQVAPGEQQPESDHHFQADQTETGVHKNRHWRHASGWFSYDLKDKDKQARTVRITYFGLDNNRDFDILINNTLLANVKLDGSKGENFFEVDYAIPAEVVQNAKDHILTIKFVAHAGSLAGGIYGVRLLNEEMKE